MGPPTAKKPHPGAAHAYGPDQVARPAAGPFCDSAASPISTPVACWIWTSNAADIIPPRNEVASIPEKQKDG